MSEKHLGNNYSLKWTPEHDELLRQLHAAGDSGARAAVEINRKFHTDYTRNAVIGRKHRLKMTEPMEKRKPKVARLRGPAKPPAPKVAEPKLAREEIILRCVEVEPRHVRLLDLAPNECKWPYGDENFTFCGHRALGEGPYCAAHQRLSERAPR